jgi:hypothetical protein
MNPSEQESQTIQPYDLHFQPVKIGPVTAPNRGAQLETLRVIGDAEAPSLIAQAVYSGHLAAQEFDEDIGTRTPFKVERVR